MAASRGYLSAFMLPIIAGLLFLFLAITASQQTLQQRWHLQSAADGMVHSAATIMAREFNVLAVLNRAIIANQVAQAQLLGLSSWYRNIATASERLAQVTSWIPYVNAVTAQISQVIETVDQPLQGFIEIGLIAQEALISAIQVVQLMVRFSFAQIVPEALAELARLQGVESHSWSLVHSPGLIEFPWLWWTFIPPQSAARDDQRLAQLVRRSRDPFSTARSYNWFRAGLVKAAKTGGTELVLDEHGYWSWQALDTVALHIDLLFSQQEIPWGNGAAYRGDSIAQPQTAQFGASQRTNPRATRWALTDQTDFGSINSPNYFDRTNLQASEWPSVIVIFDDVIAKAGVVYSRPLSVFPRRDDKPEQANLFNALWQPALQSLSTVEKMLISQFHKTDNADD